MTNLTVIKNDYSVYTNKLHTVEIDTIHNYTMITGYGKENGFPYLYIFRPRATKPFVKFYFRTLDKLATYAGDVITEIKKEHERKEAQKLKSKEFNVSNVLTPGDFLYESWGWEQTNVYFYQVIKIKSRTQIVVKQVRCISSDPISHGMADHVDPDKDNFIGDEMVINVRHAGTSDGFTAKAGRQYLYKYDGVSKYRSWYA
jgi:hypothetical protein